MTPPKKPSDRDVLVPKHATPPKGVSTGAETWDDEESPEPTGQIDLQPPRKGTDDDTPVGLATIDAQAEARLRHRVKETNANVLEVKSTSQATSEGVSTLRLEMHSHVKRLEQTIETKIEEVKADTTQQISVLSESVNGLTNHVIGAMSTVNNAVLRLNDFQGQVVEGHMERERMTFEAHTKKSVIRAEEEADAKKQSRAFKYTLGSTALKVLGALGAAVAGIVATLLAQNC